MTGRVVVVCVTAVCLHPTSIAVANANRTITREMFIGLNYANSATRPGSRGLQPNRYGRVLRRMVRRHPHAESLSLLLCLVATDSKRAMKSNSTHMRLRIRGTGPKRIESRSIIDSPLKRHHPRLNHQQRPQAPTRRSAHVRFRKARIRCLRPKLRPDPARSVNCNWSTMATSSKLYTYRAM